MRDVLLAAIVLGALPYVLRYTWAGVMLWTWISIMNPHRLTYGFAFDFPWAQLVAAATLLSLLWNQERLTFPWTASVKVLMLFLVWVCITTVFAVHLEPSIDQLIKVLKIQLFTLIALAAIQERRHIELFLWVNVLSIGYFGVKGGVFVIRSGGGERVWGPAGSYIEGNNELGLAIVLIIPLMYYLWAVSKQRWVRWAMLFAMLACATAAIGTYSRGAFLAIAAMVVVLWWRARSKILSGLLIGLSAALLLSFMPSVWEERMGTITNYAEDASAQGRLNAWTMAFNLANHRLTGAGFETSTMDLFERYAPIAYPRAAHSIYFQILGEHGWLGLILFLSIGAGAFALANRVRRLSKTVPDGEWLYVLAGMIQVSMVGYAVGGAFLSLAYFDLPYNILVILVACNRWIDEKGWETERGGAFGAGTPTLAMAPGTIR